MKIFTYLKGTRREYSIAVTRLDEDRVLVTGIPVRPEMTSNGSPCYRTVIVHRDELSATREAQVDMWCKIGGVGNREDNVDVVPAICELLGCPDPGVYIQKY